MKFIPHLIFALALALAAVPNAARAADITIGEFEGSTHAPWLLTGDAFGSGPILETRPAQLGERGFRGNGLASSELDGDKPQGTLTSPAFEVARLYISFVIGGGNSEYTTCVHLIVDGVIVRSATGANSDYLMPKSWDVSQFFGRNARIQIVDRASGDWGHILVDHIIQTDAPEAKPANTQPLYRETFRPQFHFTARQWAVNRLNPGQRQEGWLNDLNGLVYYAGEYHLFAQRWNKCWVHAVSADLVHWTELQPAFWEEELDSGVQSGNCVIDYRNSSGLSPDAATPPMVAFWSRNDNRSHCISYSLDKGRTWKFYDKNPILEKPERDPMVFWHEPTKKWVMMLYGNDKYHVLTSDNLLSWKDENHPIPNSFECPDMFELPLDGDHQNMKWVLVRGNGKYSVGAFDGTQFREETPQIDSDAGPQFYATQSWGNAPDGRRIQAAWMREGVYPDMPFNQQVSFPCELTLRSTPDGPRLYRQPIREIASLHQAEQKWGERVLNVGETWDLKPTGDLFHIKMQVSIPADAALAINVRGVPVTLAQNSVANGNGPHSVRGALHSVELLIDRTSIEAFANGGELAVSRCFLPANGELSLQASGGAVTIRSLSVFPLESAWKGNAAFENSAKAMM